VYNARVPNVRASGQKQVIVIMSEDFLTDIDGSVAALGFSNRAEFIRQAVLEKLAAAGVKVEKSKAAAPSRAGKGGRPKNPKP
jgi:Arc/MetJ-type ribon-helix-helix transcriptional regulator